MAPDEPIRVAPLLLEAAASMAHACHAKAIVAYVDALPELHTVPSDTILVSREGSDQEKLDRLRPSAHSVIDVPRANLDRMGQVRLSTLIALSSGSLEIGDLTVHLVGPQGSAADALIVQRIDENYSLFDHADAAPHHMDDQLQRVVFHRVLTIALELGEFGREGRSIGALFVVGDHTRVLEQSEQLILNPFKGYLESERTVMDDRMAETIREFSALDGAIVIRADGTVESAGTHLRAGLAEKLPSGLGARHAAAAGITHSTRAIAITVSSSGGVVRVWRGGRILASFEPGG